MVTDSLSGFFSFELGFDVFFLACTRLGVYNVMFAGWSSNSGYSLLCRLRVLVQTVSYEVRLAIPYLYSTVESLSSYSWFLCPNLFSKFVPPKGFGAFFLSFWANVPVKLATTISVISGCLREVC